jgi:hypothetical protein
MLLDLVIDAAGKVRSAEPAEMAAYARGWIETALAWKFIPAFRDGRPVASRLRISAHKRIAKAMITDSGFRVRAH